MTIWVDADACPVPIKEILYRAAARTQVQTVFVANQFLRLPNQPALSFLQVGAGFDVADNEIVKRMVDGDMVITNDIPLADEVITKGAQVLNHRGEALTKDNVRARLNIRDFMETMLSSGVHSGGPPPLSAADKQKFANALDSWLAKAGKP